MKKLVSRLNAKQRHESSEGEKMVDWGELGSLVSERDRRPDAHSDLTSSKLRRCREHRPIAHHRPPSATLGSFRSRRVFCLATPDDKHHWSAGTAGQMMMEPWPLFCIAAASVQYISSRVYLKKSVSQRPCDTNRCPSA
jgi:hypothetical protein